MNIESYLKLAIYNIKHFAAHKAYSLVPNGIVYIGEFYLWKI
jgi:hypothetical protein